MLYAAAAEVLLALAVDPEEVVQSGALDGPVRQVLRIAAEGCEKVERAQADRDAALLYAAELQTLLTRAADILEALPLPLEGGTWEGYMLAQQARRLMQSHKAASNNAPIGPIPSDSA
jgi:hypothetical protein